MQAAKKVVEVSDKELVSQVKKGSMEAFETLVERHETKVYNLSLKFTKNHEDAEEVLQDVFATVHRKITSFKGESAFTSWLYRITVNASFMKLRKNNQKPTVHLEDLSRSVKQMYLHRDTAYGSRSDSLAQSNELRTVLQEAINKLPDQYRAVFILRDIDGLSNQEVSNILKLSIPAVKSRLHRSRLMLRKKLTSYWNDYKGQMPLTSGSASLLGFQKAGLSKLKTQLSSVINN